jgi:hypothetical protein
MGTLAAIAHRIEFAGAGQDPVEPYASEQQSVRTGQKHSQNRCSRCLLVGHPVMMIA